MNPDAANSFAVARAPPGETLKLIPTASLIIEAGGVSKYARHGCNHCDRSPHGKSNCCAGSTGSDNTFQPCQERLQVDTRPAVAV